MDPGIKATEIVAFLYVMETSWLLDPTISLDGVFRAYTDSLARQLKLDPPAADLHHRGGQLRTCRRCHVPDAGS